MPVKKRRISTSLVKIFIAIFPPFFRAHCRVKMSNVHEEALDDVERKWRNFPRHNEEVSIASCRDSAHTSRDIPKI